MSTEDSEKADMRIVQAAAEEVGFNCHPQSFPGLLVSLLLQVLSNHGVVLSRGLMVETPNIQQILGGHLSMVTDSNEQKFLQDFTESKADTAGGRLAR